MPLSSLPPVLTHLIHNIELNRAGWLDRGLRRAILGVLFNASTECDRSEMLRELEEMGIPLGQQALDAHLTAMARQGSIILNGTTVSLSQAAATRAREEVLGAEDLEEQVKSRFIEYTSDLKVDCTANELWADFLTSYLGPLALELGASLYQMLVEERQLPPQSHAGWSERYGESNREPLRQAILQFLDPEVVAVRNFLLRLLDVAFFVQSTGLTNEQLAALTVQGKPSFVLYLDTNFIFSVLDLHVNPANAAVAELESMRRAAEGYIEYEMRAVPLTLEEARLSLRAARRECGELNLNLKLAEALLGSGVTLSGKVRRYIERYRDSGGHLSVRGYFDPYLTQMSTFLREEDIIVEDVDLARDLNDWWVNDDIVAQEKYLRSRGSRKSSEKIRRDVLLWHYVREKRGTLVENVTSAKFWLLTVDQMLRGFDAFRMTADVSDVPVCIHPTTLIQVLQFWAPRSEELDKALVQSLRLPFLFERVDKEVQDTAMRIAKIMGGWEGVGDLPVERLANVIRDQELHVAVGKSQTEDEGVAAVRHAFVEEARKSEEALRTAEARIRDLDRELHRREREARQAERLLEEVRERELDSKKAVGELEAKVDDLLQGRLDTEVKERERSRREARAKFFTWWVVVPAASLVAFSSWLKITLTTPFPAWWLSLSVLVLGLSAVGFVGSWRIESSEVLAKWPLGRRVVRSLRWIGIAAVTVAVDVFSGDLRELF